MPAGFSRAAIDLGAAEMIDRSFLIALHTGDPGNPVGNTPLARGAGNSAAANSVTVGTNGYAHVIIAQGAITAEGPATNTNTRYSNTADINFGSAGSGGGWGEIQYISVWYDANGPTQSADGNSPGNFDTCFAVMELQTHQTVNASDPFVIRARTVDFIGQNAA